PAPAAGSRDRQPEKRAARVRRPADAPPSGREPDPEALGGDPRRVRRVRPSSLEGRAGLEGAPEEAAARARAQGEEIRAVALHAGPEAGREVARAARAG